LSVHPVIKQIANLRYGVVEALKKIGYAHVTLDLLGYRRGSLNKTIASPARKS